MLVMARRLKMSQLNTSSSVLDFDRPNIEDYLPSGSIQEPRGKIRLCDLLDISPTLREAAGAIVDVFVANHTSMIDFIVLEQMTAFAVIMQKHPGWVGLLQSTVLESVGCIWFNRSEAKDREIVARKLRDHVHGADNNPLLIFPEGTCVNNHYSVMFKKGAFELGCTVCPIAIKYNKIFVDAFWNSRKQSFTRHLLQLMTSWAVVCDVWYLEPQNLKPGETPIEFAERVRDVISVRAGLKMVPWDGYLKYSRPSPKHRERNCNAANNWTLQCEPSQAQSTLWTTCPSLQCQGTESLYIGNTTTSSCNRTTCAYVGYNNQTIFATLTSQSTCPVSGNPPAPQPPPASDGNIYVPKFSLQGQSWSFILMFIHLVLQYLHLT
ncbi:hypothetical protein RHGRI_032970 [Rhododendron griersonianum]|uniref:Phospholipid/glycerol acyltransferase domain-containing protein n=1 Tax=Rhododendron griersonianum TaxID=479676 RepID=A0AAV6IDW3_9ERIC|nr:hypothetical protein RHGRI_032970 [Rhododendron griersonianum]